MYMLFTCKDLGSNNYNLRCPASNGSSSKRALDEDQENHDPVQPQKKQRSTHIKLTEVTEDKEKSYEDNVTAMIQECEKTDPNRKVNTLLRIFVE